MRPVKHSVAVVVRRQTGRRRRFLAVRRPDDDPDLPGIWGLPAASLTRDETPEDAVRRIGRDKLGVELEPVSELSEGTARRDPFLLHMVLYRGRIASGEPAVPQPVPGVTQYSDWAWSELDALVPGARKGSLCCRLCLREEGRSWD